MLRNVRDWLKNLPFNDPLQRRQASVFQVVLLIILGAALVGLPMGMITATDSTRQFRTLVTYLLLIIFAATAFILLRNGRFRSSVILMTMSLTVVLGFSLIAGGAANNGVGLLVFAVPIVLAGLLLGRGGLLLFTGLSVAFVIIAVVLEQLAPQLVGFIPNAPGAPITTISTFTLVIVVLSLFLDQFGSSLRNALISARVREHELEHLRASLETTVAERTVSLEQALAAGEQRESRLAQALEDLNDSQETIRELSAPVIPVLEGVLVAPLIGALDSRRAATLIENVLHTVEHEHATHVIFDVTGVPLVDTQVAQVLLQTTTTVRLLGAQALLVGIRPEVAQTMVALNIDMGAVRTFSSLREAISALLDVKRLSSALAK